MYEVYEMVVCNGLGIRRDNRHVSRGDTSYVPERCPATHSDVFPDRYTQPSRFSVGHFGRRSRRCVRSLLVTA